MFFMLLGILTMMFTLAVLAMNPVLLNLMPAVMLAMASFTASILLVILDAFIPYSTRIFLGRLLNKDFIFLINPAKRLVIHTAKVDDNILWLKKNVAYLISNPDDAVSFGARKAFIAYSGIGYTLNPRTLAELQMLRYRDEETRNKVYEYLLTKFNELRMKSYGMVEEREEEEEGERRRRKTREGEKHVEEEKPVARQERR